MQHGNQQNQAHIPFSCAHGTRTKIDNRLVHKMRLNIFRKMEIIQNMYSFHNWVKLEFNY